jgi:hypothetical protein
MLAGNSVFVPYELPTSFESIATTTIGSDTSNVTFSSIPSTFTHLQLRIIGRSDRSNNFDTMRLQLNADTGGNYAWHTLYGDGSSAGSSASINQVYMSFDRLNGNLAGSGTFGALIIDILDYTNTNKYKTARNLGGADNNGTGEIYFQSGLWQSTSAVTQIKVFPGVGTNFKQYSHFALYGIKGGNS